MDCNIMESIRNAIKEKRKQFEENCELYVICELALLYLKEKDMDYMAPDMNRGRLIHSLSKLDTATLELALNWATNFLNSGEDITVVWNTAAQQSAIIAKAEARGYQKARDDMFREKKGENVIW